MRHWFFFDGIDVAGDHTTINEQPQLIVNNAPYTAESNLALWYLAEPGACCALDSSIWQCGIELRIFAGHVCPHESFVRLLIL